MKKHHLLDDRYEVDRDDTAGNKNPRSKIYYLRGHPVDITILY